MATTKPEMKAEVKAEPKEVKREELFDLLLPLDANNPLNDEVTVIINGNATKIQRGKQVKVSRSIYETIMNAQEQKLKAIERRQNAEKVRNAARAANAI